MHIGLGCEARKHSVGAEGSGLGQFEFVEELPANRWLECRRKKSPVRMKIKGGVETSEPVVATAFAMEALHLH